MILNVGRLRLISLTPPESLSNPCGMFRIRSWTVWLPSSETITSLQFEIMSSAFLSNKWPVESNVILIPCPRRIEHNLQRLECMSASPPERTTSRTPSRLKWRTCFWSSSAEISFFSLFAFHMSHITHRQLHRLCGIITTIGRL